MVLKISEIFGPTIQGEVDVGLRVIFIRLSGCNLIKEGKACKWCDTLYAEEGREMSNNEILIELSKKDCQNIVISGGEPLYQKDELKNLCELLLKKGYNLYLETNGTIQDFDVYKKFFKISCSPKRQFYNVENLKELSYAINRVRFKFVYEDRESCKWFEDLIQNLNINKKMVWVMPQGKTKQEQEMKQKEVIDYCMEMGFNYTPRQHVLVYNQRRGV